MLALADDAALAHLVIAATAIPGVHGLRTPEILTAPTKHHRPYSMPPPRRRRLGSKPDRRRALELLASCKDDCTEGVLRANGFSSPNGRACPG